LTLRLLPMLKRLLMRLPLRPLLLQKLLQMHRPLL
jgi:hypothetical protein